MVERAAVAGAAGRRLTVRCLRLARRCDLGLDGLLGGLTHTYAGRRGPRGGRTGGTLTLYGSGSPLAQVVPPTATLARGFVESVRCPAGRWAAAADALLARHPVRRVALTTWPAVAEEAADGREWFTLPGRRVDQDVIRPVQGVSTVHSCLPAILAAFWPGVAFELPPAGAHDEWHDRHPEAE